MEAVFSAAGRGQAPQPRSGASKTPESYKSDASSFNIWLPLPQGWTHSAFVGHMRATGIGVVASDSFRVTGNPPEAVRICLGGPASRAGVQRALAFAAHALEELPEVATSFP